MEHLAELVAALLPCAWKVIGALCKELSEIPGAMDYEWKVNCIKMYSSEDFGVARPVVY